MKKRQWLLATIAADAPEQAKQAGVGLEIDEFCTAENMDENFAASDAVVRAQLNGISHAVLHAPFTELYPCAIDPRARQLAMDRLKQAADIAMRYGIRRMVAHSGYLPNVYFPEWFEARSAEFWREFLRDVPKDFQLLIENVLDGDPNSLRRMMDAIGDPRAAICLDVGHANVVSEYPVLEWISVLAPHLKHVHLHNNYGKYDEHNLPDSGSMDIAALLERLDICAPDASITLECRDGAGAMEWIRRISD